MKSTLACTALLCLLLISSSSFAQDDASAEKVHKNELSLNIKQVINVFWIFPQNPPFVDPYILQYRRYIGNAALRFGAGYTASNQEIMQDTIPMEYHQSLTNLRLGWQFNQDLGKHFAFYFGSDVYYASQKADQEYYNFNYGYINFKSGFSEVGLAPLLGVQFYISPRISLSTESGFRVGSFKSSNSTTYELRPEQNRENKSKGIKTEYWAPNSMYLNIRF